MDINPYWMSVSHHTPEQTLRYCPSNLSLCGYLSLFMLLSHTFLTRTPPLSHTRLLFAEEVINPGACSLSLPFSTFFSVALSHIISLSLALSISLSLARSL